MIYSNFFACDKFPLSSSLEWANTGFKEWEHPQSLIRSDLKEQRTMYSPIENFIVV